MKLKKAKGYYDSLIQLRNHSIMYTPQTTSYLYFTILIIHMHACSFSYTFTYSLLYNIICNTLMQSIITIISEAHGFVKINILRSN